MLLSSRIGRYVSIAVHGEDFVFEGPCSVFDDFVESLKKHCIIKVRAILDPKKTDDKEVSVRDRVVRWDSKGIECESDPRHVEIFLRDMGMVGCRELSSPGVKPTAEEVEKGSPWLTVDAITLYRPDVARCNCLSVDRPNTPFESKELCRSMSKPTELDMMTLEHLCRYLKGHPGLVQRIPSRVIPTWELQFLVESDWAECRRRRKSTSGGCMFLNGTCLRNGRPCRR